MTSGAWKAAAAAVLVLAVLVAGPAAAGAADPVYGVSTPTALNSKDLNELAAGKVQAVRLEISWKATKGKGGAFNWGKTDKRIEAATNRGIEVVPYLTGTPKWAKGCKGKSCRAPKVLTPETDAWLRFVDAAVDRYGPAGSLSKPVGTWQVWDTANRGSPKGYDKLLGATFRTINLADPGAKVLTGALSFAPGKGTTSPTKLLKRLMNPKVNQTFSAVGVSPQSRSVGKVKRQVKSIRKVLDKAGRKGTEIWVTPVGWASDKRSSKALSVGKAGQKKRLSQVMKSLRKGFGVGGVFWTRWRTAAGLQCAATPAVSKKGKAKPAWGAYKKFLKTVVVGPPPPPPDDPFFFGGVPGGFIDSTDAYLMHSAGSVRSGSSSTGSRSPVAAGTTEQDRPGVQAPGGERDRAAAAALRQSELRPGDRRQRRQPERRRDEPVAAFVAAAVTRTSRWQLLDRQSRHPKPTTGGLAGLQRAEQQAFWPNGPSPNKFAGFLHGTAAMIRLVDPTAKIMLGGMHGDMAMEGIKSWDFLQGLYQYENAQSPPWDDFDIVAVHPYGFSTAEITTEIDNVRAKMDEWGDQAAPIWVSEMAGPPRTTAPQRTSGGSARHRARRAS